ncbi:MAG: hypothetical protein ABEK03_11105 [Candidatus Bipolaricaulia bacterium]
MARTRRGVTAIITLLLCLSATALGNATGQTTTASDHVPLKANWRLYADRGVVTFDVPQCAASQLARLIPQAAQAAARAWNRAAERPLIAVQLTGCTDSTFPDRHNAIYAVSALEGQRLGSHLSLASGSGARLLEHDIQLSRTRLADDIQSASDGGRSVVYNVVLHEMGHALGLGHVAARPDSCGMSVMREQLCRMGARHSPTSADVAALRQIYDLGASTANPRSAPSRADDPLADYDANGNGVIDDAEFMAILDRWVVDQLSTRTFHRLLDAWAQGRQLQASDASAPRRSIRVFDLDGQPVLTQACSPQALASVQDRLGRYASRPQTFVLRTQDCDSGATSTRFITIAPH